MGPGPAAPHPRLGHAGPTTFLKPTTTLQDGPHHLHHRRKLRHEQHHPLPLKGRAGRDGVSPMDWNEITGETTMPPCSRPREGLGDNPYAECPLEGRGLASGEHGVLTWPCQCLDTSDAQAPDQQPQAGRGLPGEVHTVQLQQDLHGHGHAVEQRRQSAGNLPMLSQSELTPCG